MDYIEIEGYKSIKELKIKLEPINILIGANGSGKSNFISFFEFLDRLYNKKLQEYVGLKGGDINKFIHKGIENSNSIKGLIRFDEGVNSYSFEIKPSGNSFVFSKEVLWYYSNPLEYNNFSKEAEIKDNGWHRGQYIQKHLVGHKKYHFHDTGQGSPFNSPSQIEKDSLVMYEKGENLAAILYKIRKDEPKIYKRIISNIQSIAPYFSDFVLHPNDNGILKLFWQDKYSSYNYDVTDLSDGTMRYIALAILFLQPNIPKTIVIDEPELGLHPKAIAKLAGLIQSVTAHESQVIIATQSADLISYFKPEDIIAVDQKDGCSTFNRLKTDDLKIWLEDYSLGDLWQRNIIKKAQPF
jgi:predicted ATPase